MTTITRRTIIHSYIGEPRLRRRVVVVYELCRNSDLIWLLPLALLALLMP